MSARLCLRRVGLLGVACSWLGSMAAYAEDEKKPEFPPFEKVSEGFVEVVSTADGTTPFYRVWHRDKDAQLLAELPANFENQKFFVVPTVARSRPRPAAQRSSSLSRRCGPPKPG